MAAHALVSALLHELAVPDAAASLILAHARAVARDADRLGLVAERTLDAMVRRHSADSLLFALARRPQPGEQWLDAGSGAGFPGMVLACAFPETAFELVEPQQRRAGFLDLVALNLGLSNAIVSRRRVESLAPGIADVVTARALEDPSSTLPELRKLLRPGGAALIAVGRDAPTMAGATTVDVSRRDVDSPGQLLMMRGVP